MDHEVIAKLLDKGKLREGSALACVIKDVIYETGIVTREGIKCLCELCGGNESFGASKFEKHAGSKHKRPSKNIFVHDDEYGGYRKSLGMLNNEVELGGTPESDSSSSTSESSRSICRITTTPAESSRSGQNLESSNINTCDFCSGGGDIVTCRTRGCPAAFHGSCSLTDPLADGRWYCQKCTCRECQSPLCERTTFSSVFQGTLANHEQWNNLANCDQCGDTYHKECLLKRENYPTSFLRFCSTYCEEMSGLLGEMVKLVFRPGDALPLTWVKWNEELFLSFLENPEPDIDTWHSLGKLKAMCAQRLFGAKNLLRDCFQDDNLPSGGRNLLQKILYNHRSSERDLGHNGFFVVLIEEDKDLSTKRETKVIREVIAVATIRIHCQNVAEMPFIAVSESHRGMGYWSNLMKGLYEMLKQLEVLQWIVHSPPEFVEMWAAKHSFHSVNISAMRSLLESNLLKVDGTTILCKDI